MINLKMRRVILMQKKNLMKLGFTFFIIINLTMVGCGPQHHYAFEQFNTENKSTILSIQGYIIDDFEVKDLERDWNLLVIEMSKKPGFVSGYLSEGVGGSKLILAHSTWKDLESLRNAFSDEKVLELEAKLPKIQFEHIFNVGTLANYPGPYKEGDEE